MLKQDKDGEWIIKTADDLQQVVEAIEERSQAVSDIEQMMEEQYDYLTLKQEVEDLTEAMRLFMVENDQKHVFRDRYKLTLVRRSTTTWDESKLRKLLPKGLWLKVTKPVVDPHKIDDLVKKGDLDDKVIASALISKPQRPFLQRFDYKEGQTREDALAEEAALRAAMSGEAVQKSGRKKAKGAR